MRNRWLALLLFPLALFLAGCELENFGDSQRYQEDFQQSHPLKAGGRLYLENFNGSVDIAGWDRETIDISGTKYASTERAVNAIKVDVVVSGDSVRIRTVRPSERWGNMGARYTIRVPRKTTLDKIATSNGSIEVGLIDAPVRVTTSNGAIRADNLTSGLEAHTSNGSVTLEEVKGDLEATTSNGSIRAELAGTANGRPVRLRTSNGSIDLTLDSVGTGGVVASTSNASITLRLPSAASADLDASTSNGSINNEFENNFRGRTEKHRLEGSIGSGGARVELHTSNGRIQILKR